MFRHFAKHGIPTSRYKSYTIASSVLLGTSYAGYQLRTIRLEAQPKEKTTPTLGFPPLLNTPGQFTEAALYQYADSFIYDAQQGFGIAQCDSVGIPSNNPSEDRMFSGHYALPTHNWAFFAIFDGHNGCFTSRFLSNNLVHALIGSLADLFSKHLPISDEHSELGTTIYSGRPYPPPDEIDQTIKDTFLRVDNDIVNEAVERVFSSPSREAATSLLETAHAGSCALVSFYECDSKVLRVALTGDSRAVLGRRTVTPTGKEEYEVHVLSNDQNAHNVEEESRMNAEHPGEKIMEKGRVLGWGMSRAFGDAALKWSLEVQERLHREYLGDRPRPYVKTPPYFTAEPVITTTQVCSGDFLIMASDGLWDSLTNEEAVGLVGTWLTVNTVGDSMRRKTQRAISDDSNSSSILEREELPVQLKEDKTPMYKWWRTEKRFINVDNNVAVHLARNALGGADRDLTAALLNLQAPRSRRYRDDISVQVIFFE